MVKYLVAPARMPDELTWFKWEAYATWISGFALIVAIYYASASLYLVDPAVMALSPATGIAISLVAIALGWAVYDGLCRSPIGRNDTLLAAVGFVFADASASGMTGGVSLQATCSSADSGSRVVTRRRSRGWAASS
jgi:uncharacterized membrane protein